MVASHESLAALGAYESLLACVCAEMPLQLVRSRERLPAEKPVAHEGSLACVPTQMSFEMRGLAIDFTATRNVTNMLSLFGGLARNGRVKTVRASASSASTCCEFRDGAHGPSVEVGIIESQGLGGMSGE